MWLHVINKRTFAVFLILLTLILFSILLSGSSSVESIKAQGGVSSMQSRLQDLDSKISSSPGFLFQIQFVTPLVGKEASWTMGGGDAKTKRRIESIGNDSVCFIDYAEGAKFIYCTPFFNIASISYLDN